MGGKGSGRKSLKIRVKTQVIMGILAKKKMNIPEFAKAIPVSAEFIRYVLRGEQHPSPKTLGRMAEILEVEPYQIAEEMEPVEEVHIIGDSRKLDSVNNPLHQDFGKETSDKKAKLALYRLMNEAGLIHIGICPICNHKMKDPERDVCPYCGISLKPREGEDD